MSSFLHSITKRKKTPDQLVISAKSALHNLLDPNGSPETKLSASQTLEKRLGQMKEILYGDSDPSYEIDENKIAELSQSLQDENLVQSVIFHLKDIPFEARKDTALILNGLLRRNPFNFCDYIVNHFDVVVFLMNGYSDSELALNCGMILREMGKIEILHKMILESASFWNFFEVYVHYPNFDVASDAFSTLRDLLAPSKNKNVSFQFLMENYEKLFSMYELLLKSENYVTRRRSLKMLGEILLERSNFNIMMKYISSRENLKTIMNALRDKSANIQFEAFHIFKVFVANPNKPPEILSILTLNKAKLIAFLSSFQNEREDSQFVDEKQLLIDTLQGLPDSVASSYSVAMA